MAILSANAQNSNSKIYIQVGDRTLSVSLADNSSTEALIDLLSSGDIIIDMSDYVGMEKVGSLPQSLPQNNIQMNTVPGDVILYQGRSFVIYYGTNTWSLTPIGKVDGVDVAELRDILGTGDITIAISLQASTAGINDMEFEPSHSAGFYDMMGRKVSSPIAGNMYISNGKKILYK